jgi:hypothetical protein
MDLSKAGGGSLLEKKKQKDLIRLPAGTPPLIRRRDTACSQGKRFFGSFFKKNFFAC